MTRREAERLARGLASTRRATERGYLSLGAHLYKLRSEKVHLALGHESWDKFLKSRRINKALATFNIQVHEQLVLKLGVTDRDLLRIRKSKAYLLARLAFEGIVTQANLAEWLEKARRLRFNKLSRQAAMEQLRVAHAEVDPMPFALPAPIETPRRSTFSVFLEKEEREDLSLALARASVLAKRAGAQIQVIALEYLAGHADAFVSSKERVRFLLGRLERSLGISITARDRHTGEVVFGILTDKPILGTS